MNLQTEQAAPRGMVTIAVMLATIMQALDTTIANVALPHMQGSMGATQDQIAWVLTSYIVAAAIFMPLTGFLAARFGRRRLFLTAVAGFTVASMLCGAAQNLEQIVVFRLLQGVFGASLVPLSQSVLLDTYPPEKHGSAMAMWGVGVMVGPILGPSLGGWLTDHYSWRWVFYINLPFGLLAAWGIGAFVKETARDFSRRFDLFGFALLSLSIGALQMFLDRGESLDWFSQREIWIEALLAGFALYLFIAHILTHPHPFLEPGLFRDRNFSASLLMIFCTGIILLATMALLPPFLQQLAGYPVLDVGLLLMPRGLGTMAGMMAVGVLLRRFDPRWMIGAGILLTAFSLWEMTAFTREVSAAEIVRTGLVQGLGLGLTFVPLSTMAFSTLAARYRNEGTALFSLMRNLGSSIGISMVVALLARNSQANHAAIGDSLTRSSFALQDAIARGAVSIDSTAGLAQLNQWLSREAVTLAYLQDFRLMMWITLASLPMLLLIGGRSRRKTDIEPDTLDAHPVLD